MDALKNTLPRMNIHAWMTWHLNIQHRFTCGYKQHKYPESKDLSHRAFRTQTKVGSTSLSPLDDHSCITAIGSNQFQDLPHEVGPPRGSFLTDKRSSDSETLPVQHRSKDWWREEQQVLHHVGPFPFSFPVETAFWKIFFFFILSVNSMCRLYEEYTLFQLATCHSSLT